MTPERLDEIRAAMRIADKIISGKTMASELLDEVERLRSDPETREWAAMRQDRDELLAELESAKGAVLYHKALRLKRELQRKTERNDQLRRQREDLFNSFIEMKTKRDQALAEIAEVKDLAMNAEDARDFIHDVAELLCLKLPSTEVG
jgi:phage portal protein BeeE